MLLFCSAMSVLFRTAMKIDGCAPKNFIQAGLQTLLQNEDLKIITVKPAENFPSTTHLSNFGSAPDPRNASSTPAIALQSGLQDFAQPDHSGAIISPSASALVSPPLLLRLTGPEVLRPVLRALSWGVKLGYSNIPYFKPQPYLYVLYLYHQALC